jgi:hypothetical protein
MHLNPLAARVDLAGSHIRNSVFAAAVLAHDENVPMGWKHVQRAFVSDYRKLGRQIPVGLQMPAGDER